MDSVTVGVREKRMAFLKKCVSHCGSPEFTRDLRFHIYDLADDWVLSTDEIKSTVYFFTFK